MRVAELEEDLTADLVALLLDEDRYVANVAGLVLSEQASIHSNLLGKILQAVERGTEGAGGALGRVDSSEAAKVAVRRLIEPETSNRSAYEHAARLQSARAIPFIVKAARCAAGCGEQRHTLLGKVLEGMGPERADAGPGLLAIASDDAAPRQVRAGALAMIARLGPVAVEFDEALLSLRDAKPQLETPINKALIGLESDAAGGIFAARLSRAPKLVDMYELAYLGQAGYSAGPVVEELLSHPDWDIRLQAVRTLALIGFEPAVDSMLDLLTTPEDVVLNWMAADAMAHLQAFEAIKALQELADNHWHPHVRERARLSRDRLLGLATFDKEARFRSAALVAYSQQVDAGEACDELDVHRAPWNDHSRLKYPEDKEPLRALSYPEDVVTTSNVHGQNGMRTPGVAMRVDGGWLVGSDRGEWGGELVFIDRNGSARVLVEENIENILRFDDGSVVAVTGLAHMFTSRGMLYRVERAPDESWMATRWRRLPGAPRSSYRVRSGEVLVTPGRGGSVLVSPEGRMRMAPCKHQPAIQ